MIKFGADAIKIKPPKISGEIDVVLTTGVYELEKLKEAFTWQGDSVNLEVTVRRMDEESE